MFAQTLYIISVKLLIGFIFIIKARDLKYLKLAQISKNASTPFKILPLSSTIAGLIPKKGFVAEPGLRSTAPG